MLHLSMVQHRRMRQDGVLTIWGTINNLLLLLLLFWCCICPWYSIAARIRMGKKVEKALSKDKNHSSASHDTNDDDPNKTPGQWHWQCFSLQRKNAFVSFSQFLAAWGTVFLHRLKLIQPIVIYDPNQIPDQWQCFSFWDKNAFVSFSFSFSHWHCLWL